MHNLYIKRKGMNTKISKDSPQMFGMNRKMELKDFVLSTHRDINLVADTSQLAAVAAVVLVSVC